MKKLSLFSLLIILLISCETSYDSSKEVSINIEIDGDDVTEFEKLIHLQYLACQPSPFLSYLNPHWL